jgi:hypothetical protein
MELARVGTYPSLTEAELVKARLEVNGIDAVVQADSASGAVPFLEVLEGVRVFVRQSDLPEALEILERMLPAPGPMSDPEQG